MPGIDQTPFLLDLKAGSGALEDCRNRVGFGAQLLHPGCEVISTDTEGRCQHLWRHDEQAHEMGVVLSCEPGRNGDHALGPTCVRQVDDDSFELVHLAGPFMIGRIGPITIKPQVRPDVLDGRQLVLAGRRPERIWRDAAGRANLAQNVELHRERPR